MLPSPEKQNRPETFQQDGRAVLLCETPTGLSASRSHKDSVPQNHYIVNHHTYPGTLKESGLPGAPLNAG